MQIGGQEPASPKVGRVLEAGEGSWDLRAPPSREEAGMPTGESVVIYEPHGWLWWDRSLRTHVLLPEGKRIDTEAGSVAFDSYGAACPVRSETADPTTMDISAGAMPLDEARQELLRAAEEFGFYREEIESWHAEAASREDATERVKTPFLRSEVGYLTIEVQGRFNPIGDDHENAFVHYTLTWAEPFDPDACKKTEETTAR